MTPSTSQSGLFSESYWLKIGPHPTKDIFLTPPPLLQWIFNDALYVSCSRYRTVVTSYCLDQAWPEFGHCHNLCLIILSPSQVPVSAISDISGQWWSPWSSPARSVSYLDLISEFDSPGHRADTCDSFKASDWLEIRLRALTLAQVSFDKGGLQFGETYFIYWLNLIERITRGFREGRVYSENWDKVPMRRIKCRVQVN